MKNGKIDQWRKVTFVPWLSSVSFSFYIYYYYYSIHYFFVIQRLSDYSCHTQLIITMMMKTKYWSSCLFLCLQRVEKASEFGVPEVFSRKKPAAGTRLAPPLESSGLLKDQDDAHIEGKRAKEK